MNNNAEIINALEALKSPEKEKMLLWYSDISKNGFFDTLGNEDLLQAAFSQYVKIKYPTVLYHHSPNEGKRGAFASWKIKLFIIRSMPDCMIYKPKFKENGIQHCGLAIELKYANNRVTELQKEVLEELKTAGWQTWVCSTLGNAISMLHNYMK